jgi:hypothetical protein
MLSTGSIHRVIKYRLWRQVFDNYDRFYAFMCHDSVIQMTRPTAVFDPEKNPRDDPTRFAESTIFFLTTFGFF